MNAQTIPNYRLYGEDGEQAEVEFVHCESIPQRSALHDWNIRPHRHDTLYQLFHVDRGGGTILLEGESVPIPLPCLIMVPPLTVHGFRFERDIGGSVVTVNEKAVERILATAPGLMADLAEPRILHGAECGIDFNELGGFFDRINGEYFGRDPGRLCALQSWLGLVFLQLGRSIATETRQRLSVADKRTDQLRRFRGLVEERFREHLTIAAYAVEMGMTPTHLNRICRTLLDRSALAVVHDRLLLEAKRNLLYTSMTVKEISNSLGFSDPGYFTRFFSKGAGTSPTDFRLAEQQRARAERSVA